MNRIATVLPGHLKPGEERTVILHDGSENTPVMIDEVLDLIHDVRRSEWAKRNAALRQSGAFMMSDQLFIEPLQPIMMADGAAIAGTAEANAWPIQFSTLAGSPPFLHKAQQHVEFVAFGVLTSAATTPGTCTITPRWGTTTAGAAMGPSAASATLTASKTNVPFYATGNYHLRSLLAGANSVLVAGGDFCCDQVAIPGLCFGGTVVSTVDVTATGGVWLGITLGSASDSLTTRALMLKNVS